MSFTGQMSHELGSGIVGGQSYLTAEGAAEARRKEIERERHAIAAEFIRDNWPTEWDNFVAEYQQQHQALPAPTDAPPAID